MSRDGGTTATGEGFRMGASPHLGGLTATTEGFRLLAGGLRRFGAEELPDVAHLFRVLAAAHDGFHEDHVPALQDGDGGGSRRLELKLDRVRWTAADSENKRDKMRCSVKNSEQITAVPS